MALTSCKGFDNFEGHLVFTGTFLLFIKRAGKKKKGSGENEFLPARSRRVKRGGQTGLAAAWLVN